MKFYRLPLFWLLAALLLPPLHGQNSSDDTPIPEGVTIETPKSTTDELIKTRLENIFSAVESLSKIKVEVKEGVTTLTGTAANATAASEAKQLASRLEGVIYVNDQMEEDVQVQTRLKPTWDKVRELGQTSLRKLPLIAIALVTIALFTLAGRLVARALSLTRRFGLNELSANLIKRTTRLVFIGLGIFTALEILDATAIAGALLGIAGVAGLALGFAFQNIVENYLAGILLSLRNPFTSGDAIEIDGLSGKVIRLTSRDTVMMSYDGNHIRVPNSAIMTSALTNFSRNPLRRFDFAVGVSTELNLIEVRKKGLETFANLDSVLADPAPLILIEDLGDSTVNLRFSGWVDQRKNDFSKTKSEAIRLIKVAFDTAGFEMPEPIYRVRMKEVSDTPQPAPTMASDEAKPPASCESEELSDTAVDKSIDQQLENARRTEGEPNLLDENTKNT